MTTITHTHATLAEFEVYDAQHPDLRVEWVGGEIVEVPSNPYSSQIAALLKLLDAPERVVHYDCMWLGYLFEYIGLGPYRDEYQPRAE